MRKKIFAVFIICTICLLVSCKEKTVNEKSVIRSVYYYRGGNSLGETYSLLLEDNLLKESSCNGNNHKTIDKEYKIDTDIYDEVVSAINDYDLRSLHDLGDNQFIAFDGDVVKIRICFTNGEVIEFDTTKDLPDTAYEAIDKLLNILESYIK